MTDNQAINERAASVRRRMVMVGSYCSSSIHWGSSLSCVEMLVYAVGKTLVTSLIGNNGSSNSELVVSKGHAALAYYSVLADYGLISSDFIRAYQGDGSDYSEELMKNPQLGISCTTGSLGLGLPFAVGKAISKKRSGCKGTVFCIVGDGELDEGAVWEAIMLAAQQNLNNLVLMVDFNGLQSDGPTDGILSWKSIENKFSAFGWYVQAVNGHDISAIDGAVQKRADKPRVLICHTVKGKGISFMENDPSWHDRALRGELLEKARIEVSLP